MDISESLEQVFSSTDLIGTQFYKRFLANCPEAEAFFKDVDMQRQSVVVTMALTLVEQYYKSPYIPTEAYFRYLGSLHRDREIPKEMYPIWVDSMMQTLAAFHGKAWDEELASQWQQGFDSATRVMLAGYDLPV